MMAALLLWVAPIARGDSSDEPSRSFAQVGDIQNDLFDEASGLVASRAHSGVYWTINDSGYGPYLLAFDGAGQVVCPDSVSDPASYVGLLVSGAQNVDWEELAFDADGNLLIFDFGDNSENRADKMLYIVAEPDPTATTFTTVSRAIPLRYADKVDYPTAPLDYNAEAAFVADGRVYVIVKPDDAEQGEAARLYRMDDLSGNPSSTLEYVSEFNLGELPTGADVTADGATLAVLTYRGVWLFARPEGTDDYFAGVASRAPIPIGELYEGIAFDNGESRLLIVAEKQYFNPSDTRSTLYEIATSDIGARTGSFLTFEAPGPRERTLAEMRDFYVTGTFSDAITSPGNLRIDLYQGPAPSGTPVRTIASHVDAVSGVTTTGALRADYAEGIDWGNTRVADLIQHPGGFLYPGNKLLVDPHGYMGLIQGGCTKGFDTTYTHASGQPLTDLTAGAYTLRVVGTSGEVEGLIATRRIWFGRTATVLSRFSPENHFERVHDFALQNGWKTLEDWLPGYYWSDAGGYEIRNRWKPNNAIEVVNHLAGTASDTVTAARNALILHNVSPISTFQTTEIATLARFGLIDSDRTLFYRYDIGEPEIVWRDMSGTSHTLTGQIVPFETGKRIALTRTEVRDDSGLENLYTPDDETMRAINMDLSNGVSLRADRTLSVFGIVKPIPTSVTSGAYAGQFFTDNRIASLVVRVRNTQSGSVEITTRTIGLERVYDPLSPEWLSESIYAFRHEYRFGGAGEYVLECSGIDTQGAPVAGTSVALQVRVDAAPRVAPGWQIY